MIYAAPAQLPWLLLCATHPLSLTTTIVTHNERTKQLAVPVPSADAIGVRWKERSSRQLTWMRASSTRCFNVFRQLAHRQSVNLPPEVITMIPFITPMIYAAPAQLPWLLLCATHPLSLTTTIVTHNERTKQLAVPVPSADAIGVWWKERSSRQLTWM